MNTLRLVVPGLAVLVVIGCADGRAPTAPSAMRSLSADLSVQAATPVQTSGSFDVTIDFSTVTLTPKGGNCLLQVQGQATFHGTIQGTATGITSALEFAPCSEVAVHPPGTFPDVFHFDGTFHGTVAGQPADANLMYAGRVQVGGAIDGRFVFSKGIEGRLDVDAIVAVGGTYSGQVVVQ